MNEDIQFQIECLSTELVDAYGAFESPNIPSYDIMVENENMLYKHVKCDLVKSKI